MKIFANKYDTHTVEAFHSVGFEHAIPIKPIPPHERKKLLNIELDDTDFSLFKDIFSDEDTAMAAIQIIANAPPEIQILAVQLINIIKEVA